MISILIPVYQYDIGALLSVLREQCEGKPVRIICLDDASPDPALVRRNREAAEKAGSLFLSNESNQGRTRCRNRLAGAADTDFLLFLDADVMPVSADFIDRYLDAVREADTDAFFGGYRYREDPVPGCMLRWEFGRKRESQTAAERQAHPYRHIFSGNLLIRKSLFEAIPFPDENTYGFDLLLSAALAESKAKVRHPDNPIWHDGLEPDAVFFAKSLQAVQARFRFLATHPALAVTNPMTRRFLQLRRLRLLGLAKAAFRLWEPLLKKRILAREPDLFCFDLYRLGYLCTLA